LQDARHGGLQRARNSVFWIRSCHDVKYVGHDPFCADGDVNYVGDGVKNVERAMASIAPGVKRVVSALCLASAKLFLWKDDASETDLGSILIKF